MIKELKNPITSEYLELKDIILSPEFPWYNSGVTIHPGIPILEEDQKDDEVKDFNLFGHSFLSRPNEKPYTKVDSQYAEMAMYVANQILNANGIDVFCFYRLAANYVIDNCGKSPKHVDHHVPHNNLLIYLNDADGGETLVYDEDGTEYSSFPKENKAIVFDGLKLHRHRASSNGKRIALVATYLEHPYK